MSLTSGRFNPMSRFGFHKQYLLEHSPNYKDKEKAECYIPTRLEVCQEPIADLKPIISNWFTNAPKALVPNQDQRKLVIDLLKKRSDSARFAAEIDELESL